jgi:hypothetical protein
VPSLWRLETANGLQVAIRRKRIDVAFRDRALTHLAHLPITIDPETDAQAWTTTLQLADRFSSRSTTRPIWSWRSAARSRSPRWIVRCARPPLRWV